jgi:hypothetical protein
MGTLVVGVFGVCGSLSSQLAYFECTFRATPWHVTVNHDITSPATFVLPTYMYMYRSDEMSYECSFVVPT